LQDISQENSELMKVLEIKEKADSKRSATYINEPNEINLELFLAPDYYQATMERYEEIIRNKLFFIF
jgi:hypothetical protein